METFITKLLHLPPVASEHGPAIDRLMFYVHILMVVLFVGWGIFFAYTLWRYRQRKQAQAQRGAVKGHVSSYLEATVAGIEALLLFAIAVPLWSRSASISNFPPPEDSTVVRVIGRQFNWLFRYPGADGQFGAADPKLITAQNPLGVDDSDPAAKDDITSVTEMVVPVNKPVIAHVSSLDVIHSFAVKNMRVTQDAIPGMSVPVWFTPTRTGTYQITCAQLCGVGHASMRGLLRVVTPEEYESWVRSKTKVSSAVSYE